ncbi:MULTISPECIES: M20/M25/M40 family metallo-hydrolase [Bacillus]|uniref:Peptidase M20 n=2 Tax=Bacillus TaxID=1386 RepID=A0A0M4GB58_9BACI|nr:MULTISPECIES: M20/M25/M40 family metallo-hydrolase [Bacillus]ALC82870.1 peptidase M20 [Bacillus gobiensis]MBP1081839.1 arginine utilization protein RocB [Bacillus capparidis]MED1096488.1 M20/M25/M40 family metallo-hydrolase [Bacillus capparidis]
MYKKLKNLPLTDQVEALTASLVQTLSINGTDGEVKIAEKIEQILRSFPYFKQRPDQVWTQELPNDAIGRKNVFAHIKGNVNSKKTVVFHAHIDTVGIEDFGAQQSIANDPAELLKYFQTYSNDEEIQTQALTGDWMFGRGALDMKSGVAVHLMNVLHFSEHLEDWDGDIIFMANPVEENQHSGVIAAVDELLRLRVEEGLDYVVAVNTDYISALYPGDTNKYIFTGAGGKLLPCFYVYGRETHAGQTLNGLDPTLITSELNKRINNNMKLTEHIEGELITPPSALYHRDTKEFYNVQTAVTSHLYFNFMVLEASPKDIMEKLKVEAKAAAAEIKAYYEENYKAFARVNQFPSDRPNWDINVYSYAEYCEKLSVQGIDVKAAASQVLKENPALELRDLCFKVVDRLRELDQAVTPCVIVFYAPPYCPHNYLTGKDARDREILQTIEEATARTSARTSDTFLVKKFFPYLTDSSYLSLHDTDEEVDYLVDNFPEWNKIYPVPIKNIRKLNIPSINVGVYGFDAHRWTERVYKPYSFDTVPRLIRNMTRSWLKVAVNQ